MENPSSPLDTLRQLKEMLDAGALTPTEFEALKQRLVFAPGAAAAEAPAPVVPPAAAPVIPAVSPPLTVPVAPLHDMPVAPPATPPASFHPNPADAPQDTRAAAWVFEPTPEPLPGAAPDFSANAGGPGYSETNPQFDDTAVVSAAPPPERTSSLGLVLAIAGVLVFLAVVAYLNFTRPVSEHISSTSQTAADSVAAPIETGPQAAPLPATAAVPETVRVVPTHPAPALPARAAIGQRAAAVRDSAGAVAVPAPADSAVRR